MKTCTACKVEKPATHENFHRHPRGIFGLNPKCRPCRRRHERKHKDGRYVDLVPGMRTCSQCKVEKPLDAKHFHVRREIKSGFRRICKPCTTANERRCYAEAANDRRAKQRERWRADVNAQLSSHVRNKLNEALRGRKKSTPTFELVGYTVDDLRTHLEKTFKPGMSWKNRSRWHIDHILPRVLFDHTDIDQLRQCWALSNLRALWKVENLSKGARVNVLM